MAECYSSTISKRSFQPVPLMFSKHLLSVFHASGSTLFSLTFRKEFVQSFEVICYAPQAACAASLASCRLSCLVLILFQAAYFSISLSRGFGDPGSFPLTNAHMRRVVMLYVIKIQVCSLCTAGSNKDR